MWMWCLRTWFSTGLGNAALMVGLHDLTGLVQPKPFYDSMILRKPLQCLSFISITRTELWGTFPTFQGCSHLANA